MQSVTRTRESLSYHSLPTVLGRQVLGELVWTSILIAAPQESFVDGQAHERPTSKGLVKACHGVARLLAWRIEVP
jgi:hypothetical protein